MKLSIRQVCRHMAVIRTTADKMHLALNYYPLRYLVGAGLAPLFIVRVLTDRLCFHGLSVFRNLSVGMVNDEITVTEFEVCGIDYQLAQLMLGVFEQGRFHISAPAQNLFFRFFLSNLAGLFGVNIVWRPEWVKPQYRCDVR